MRARHAAGTVSRGSRCAFRPARHGGRLRSLPCLGSAARGAAGDEAATRKAPMHDANTVYDYIIVGAGTAGCLLANRLSADPAKRVLLIEAGGRDDYHWIHIPVGYLYCIGNPRTDWLYQTEPDPGLNGRTLRYPRGKTLGGCFEHQRHDLHARPGARLRPLGRGDGRRRLALGEVLPYFKVHEDHTRALTSCTARAAPRPNCSATTGPAATAGGCASAARAANGASRSSACAGTSSTRSPPPRWRPASPPRPTSTAATTKASATSRSTSARAGAGTRRRRSCGRRAAAAPI